jgi:hypothetical protein
MLVTGVLHITFIMFEIWSFYSWFLQSFYHDRMLNFVRIIFCIYWDDCDFCSWILFIFCTMFIDLNMLNHPCILGMKPTCSWCMVFLICCQIQFMSILFRIFYVHQDILSIVFFFDCVLIQFWCQGNNDLIEWAWKHSFLFYFMESSKEHGVSSSLMIW